MPNRSHHRPGHLDQPLLDYLDGATHVSIRCTCHREVIWMTADLVAKVPRAVTYAEYKARLVCRCGRRGWASIDPIPRR